MGGWIKSPLIGRRRNHAEPWMEDERTKSDLWTFVGTTESGPKEGERSQHELGEPCQAHLGRAERRGLGAHVEGRGSGPPVPGTPPPTSSARAGKRA